VVRSGDGWSFGGGSFGGGGGGDGDDRKIRMFCDSLVCVCVFC
jgi:hypothetical protein